MTSHPACFPRYELYLKAVVSRHEHKSGCRSFDGGSSQTSGRQAAASGRPYPQQAGGVILQADATTSRLQQQQQQQQQGNPYGSRSPRIGTPRGATPVSSVRPVEMRPPSDMEDSRAIVRLGGGFQVGVLRYSVMRSLLRHSTLPLCPHSPELDPSVIPSLFWHSTLQLSHWKSRCFNSVTLFSLSSHSPSCLRRPTWQNSKQGKSGGQLNWAGCSPRSSSSGNSSWSWHRKRRTAGQAMGRKAVLYRVALIYAGF